MLQAFLCRLRMHKSITPQYVPFLDSRLADYTGVVETPVIWRAFSSPWSGPPVESLQYAGRTTGCLAGRVNVDSRQLKLDCCAENQIPLSKPRFAPLVASPASLQNAETSCFDFEVACSLRVWLSRHLALFWWPRLRRLAALSLRTGYLPKLRHPLVVCDFYSLSI